ncbi:hypothetical protein BJV82DRAFT_598104 [Fennellomyces sp. T-0311]|nr:hypothetical protein BJV82DRAFT_598104 [Fennellomyces sp. T-0311]
MSAVGGLVIASREQFILHVQSAQAMIALSAVTLIGSGVQAYRYRRIMPYTLIAVASFSLLIQAAITGSMDQSTREIEGVLSAAIAAYFFGAIVPIIAFVLVFYTFQAALPSGQGKTVLYGYVNSKLYGTFMGYLWAFILFISTIGFVGTVASLAFSSSLSMSSYRSAVNAVYTGQFINYGLWAFFAFFGYQLWESWGYIRHFLYTFAAYVGLLFLVVIGKSVGASYSAIMTDPKSTEAAEFAMGRLFMIFALVVVLVFGHTWTASDDQPVLPTTAPVQQQPNPSSASADKTEVTEQA